MAVLEKGEYESVLGGRFRKYLRTTPTGHCVEVYSLHHGGSSLRWRRYIYRGEAAARAYFDSWGSLDAKSA